MLQGLLPQECIVFPRPVLPECLKEKTSERGTTLGSHRYESAWGNKCLNRKAGIVRSDSLFWFRVQLDLHPRFGGLESFESSP